MRELPFKPPDLGSALVGLIGQIPRGKVTTYGGLAEAIGNPIAARWVGHFLLNHPHDAACSCHRVVRADGQIGQYIDRDPSAKARRLAADGISIVDGCVDVGRLGFSSFRSDRPLEQLRRVQEAVARQVKQRRRTRLPRRVAAVDVSYPTEYEAVAAMAVVDLASGELQWSTTVRRRIEFPYITSYLTFRELPVLLDLVEAVRRAGVFSGRGDASKGGGIPEPVLVDGSGILHPRRVGIASHFGVAAGLATIGVTKKLLVGTVDLEGLAPGQSRPVIHEGTVLGTALRPTAASRRPIFVSPGHRVDVAFADRLVKELLLGRRLPEPLYWADRISRDAGRTAGGNPPARPDSVAFGRSSTV